MSFLEEFSQTTDTKKTTTGVPPTPVAKTSTGGSFFDEFTAPQTGAEAPVAPKATVVTPPKIENPTIFSSFFDGYKKLVSSFVSDAANTFVGGIIGMPRDVAIYGTKAVKSLSEGVSKGFKNDSLITDEGYSPDKGAIEENPTSTFYQDIIDDLGKGKLDNNNWDTKIQNKVKEFGNKLQEKAGVDVNNRTFGQNLAGGFGSMAGFFVPSVGLARTATLLARGEKTAEIYRGVGNVSMTVNESLMEGNGVFQDVYSKTGDVQEAQRKADNTVSANLILIGITNKYSKYFERTASGFANTIKGVLTTAISEGPVQEAGQQVISNINTDRPIFEGVKDAALIGAIVGGVTHLAGRTIAPEDKAKLNEAKEKILEDNKSNPVVEEYAKNDKILTEVLDYVQSTKEVETPEEVVTKLVEAGLDQGTAVKMINESVLEDIRNSTEQITPEAIQSEIDTFMGGEISEETNTTENVSVKETKTDIPEQEISQEVIDSYVTKYADTLNTKGGMDGAVAMSEVIADIQKDGYSYTDARDIVLEINNKNVEEVWDEKFAETEKDLNEEIETLEKQVKTAKGERKRVLNARIGTANEKLQELRNDFVEEYAPEQADEIAQLKGVNNTHLENKPAPEVVVGETYNNSYGNTFKVESIKEDKAYNKDGDTMSVEDLRSWADKNYVGEVPKGSTRYEITVKGERVFADFNENYSGMTHIEFHHKKGGPISETGYKSYFAQGTAEANGVSKENIQVEIQKVADNLAEKESKTRKPVKAKKTTKKEKVKEGDSAIDIVSDKAQNEDNERDRPKAIPDTSDVSTGADLGSGEEATSEVSGYDRATMLAQSGNGLGIKGRNGLTKSQRQLINEEVETLLEARNYSTNPNDYSENDIDLMRAYSGAGGKESVGGEGQGLLNEYYTPQEVVYSLWNIVERLAPNAETAFEPSAGTGRIISASPTSIKTDGAEISKVSGTIAQVLNPDSTITIGDFQELFFDKKSNKAKVPQQYDVVIGNPPFGDRAGFLKGKGEEKDINRQEEYFIKRGLDMTKEGGYLVYVVNSSFLKTGTSKGKEAISNTGHLVLAYRLPENSFEDTSIGTDIVVFKKVKGSEIDLAPVRSQSLRDDIYFRANPQNVLGETEIRKNRFGQTETYVKGSLEEALSKIILPKLQIPVEDTFTVKNEEESSKVAEKKQKTVKNTGKVAKKEKPVKDTQATLPKANASELVVPAQDISNKKNTNPVEIQMLGRIERDMSIPNPTPEEMKYLNVGKGGQFYPDAIYFAGEIYEKLDLLAGNKKFIVDNYGQAQYDKQEKGLEAKLPKVTPIKEIIFDPIDRHVGGLKAVTERNGVDVETTVLGAFTSYIRQNSVAMSPRVTKYDIIRYVNGEQAAKETKPIMGYIKSDAKRLFNHFIKNELDPTIQKEIEDKYNKEKNGYAHPDYSQIPVEVTDMAKGFRGNEFKMSQTQKNGVGFLVNKGSGLIAYGVGVGKTHTLAIATKANLDKGWTKRPLFTVPKTTISKTWIGTLHEMFPTLKINNLEGLQAPVVARLKRERGEDPKNWIQDGELTVISHEGLLRLGFNEDELRSAAGDLQDAIWKDESTKRAKEGQKNKFDEILGNAQKYVTDIMISDLGIDHISVDEVHNFRKIFQGAKPENLDEEGKPVGRKRYGNVVGGTPSKRAQQLFLIAQYIQKKYGNRNVFLASATPFENHATEVYNILSLVARDRMKQMGILNINDFFSVFANFEVELDRKLNGEWLNTEKMKSFSNLPALQGLLKEFIDYQEDPTLVRPERRVITPHLQMSEKQEENLGKIQNLLSGTKEMVDDTQAFAEDSKTMYGVSEGGAEDGAFLKASTYSIANSVSPYFIKEYAGTAPSAKELVEQSPKIKYTLEALKTVKADPKTKNFGSFVFFGKMGVEYHPMLAEYFAKELGYKPTEVAYLSGDVTDEQKESIKEKFNNGEIKVLLGGDQTKEGIDLQNNGFMTFNLALGWNPTQIQQVEGRVWRQGNNRSIAPLVYPLVENSGDAMIYNKFEEKGGRINDLFSYAGTMFDVGEVDPSEKKLSLLTNPKDKAKMQIEIDKTVLYNERVLLDNDIKALNKIRADINQTKGNIEYYTEEIPHPNLLDQRKKEYQKELKTAEVRLVRLEAKLKEKNISNLDEEIGNMEAKLIDFDAKIKEIDKTYEPLLAKFTAEYNENIKKRKTIAQHMEEIKGLISELKERTSEEVRQLRDKKIAELEAIKKAGIPEFQRIEDTPEDIKKRGDLVAKAIALSADQSKMTIEEFEKKQAEIMAEYEMLGQPSFQREDTRKEPMINFEEGKKRLEVYKKRLGLNFDVDFADVIFTGELKRDGSKVRAYAVTYNNKITLTDNIKLTTADHEMVHIVVDNIDKISAFEGITKEQLLKAQNGGKEVNVSDRALVEKLNEDLAIGFQNKVLGEEQSNIPMVIRRFYDKLQILLTDLLRSLGIEVNVIADFYRKMATAKSENSFTLTSIPVLDNRAKFERNGKAGLDFSFEQLKEMDDIRRAGFEKIEEMAKDHSINLRRKDINYIENLVAISRDLYLKDKNEFAQADTFMKIGDNRRMKKELLDQKFADMLKPYYELSKEEQKNVNKLLMQGDMDSKEYGDAELTEYNLTEKQVAGYKATRKAFNVAHQLLIDEMEANGVRPEEIETFKKTRTGYMPHKWKYRFAIKTQRLQEGSDPRQGSNWKTVTMDVYKTAREADKVFKKLQTDNKYPDNIRYVNDTLDSLDVDFFSEQRFSFENMKSIIAKARTGNDVKDQMIGAMRDIIKEKGFGRQFIKRTGIQGYETNEIPEIVANYFAGLNGFVTKMEAGKLYYGVLEKVDARRQKNFYAWLRDSIAYDMGQTAEWNMAKQVAFVFHLANDMSFLLTNATQNWTVGVGELSKLFTSGAGKSVGGEAYLIKATTDWAIGNVTPEEKLVITGLTNVGRLGGEMAAELMGFKNNPLYTALGTGVSTALYKTTAFVEKNVNRVPAFLAARRILKAQGLSDKEANEKALEVSDDINFRGGKQHRPVFMRGKIGTLFVFNTYIRSFIYQLSRDLKEKQFVALSKKMFYTALLGGYTALPLAKYILWVIKSIFPDDDEVKDELNTWELALKKGPISAFANVDMSSRVGIDIFLFSNIFDEVKSSGSSREVVSNILFDFLGAVGSLAFERFPKGVELLKQERYMEAFGKLLPDFLGNPIKAYNGVEYGVTTQAGNPLTDENGEEFKYTTYEGVVKALGFTPTREALAWEENSKAWIAKDTQSAKSSIVQGKIKRQIREGDIEGAKATQQEALSTGDITENSTDYVKKAVEEKSMRESYETWNTGEKSRAKLDSIERTIAKNIYGDKYTPLQLTNVTRDFAFYRTFGFDDALANEIKKAPTTKEKVDLLRKAREEMGLEVFKTFYNKGRTVVKYENTSKGSENTGYVLISDTLKKAYFSK